jgi:LL-diaminopimelate aminotransferase
MIRINENYLKLQASYLFSEIRKRTDEFQEANPDKDIIKLGIGDVTRPLPQACIEALHRAVDEMADDATFRGYGPEQGYEFLREDIARVDFQDRGADISAAEVFVSDGAKCDSGNIQELFATDIRIAIPDPVYPVYLDTNVMAGRTAAFSDGRYGEITYLESTRENGFRVDFAREKKALILFDAAYESFIQDPDLPKSIFEIEGAREVAIEFRSFSKTAGFTGTRCAYTVVPTTCTAYSAEGQTHSVHDLWFRRQSTKFNAVSYPVQRAAAAVYSDEGRAQAKALIEYYLKNAALIRTEMEALGYECVGGENSPYIWIYGKTDSWQFFDLLLKKAGVVCTPGAGFGKCGEGFIRISAFNNYESVQLAMQRIKQALS